MAKVYDGHQHTHVFVTHPKSKGEDDRWMDDGWHNTFPIIMHTGEFVWVPGSYAHEGHPLIKRIGDGRNKGYDEYGNCILSVPAEWCSYYTEKEAGHIEACIDADDRLLGYM